MIGRRPQYVAVVLVTAVAGLGAFILGSSQSSMHVSTALSGAPAQLPDPLRAPVRIPSGESGPPGAVTRSEVRPDASPLPNTTSPSSVPILGRADVLALVAGSCAEVPVSRRMEAKLVTLADFWKVTRLPGEPVPVDLPASREVWMVAVAGQVRPPFARGETFAWGVYGYDRETGTLLGTAAGPGPWPPSFALLIDKAGKTDLGLPAGIALVHGESDCTPKAG